MAITNKLWLLAGLAAAWGEEAWTAGNLRIGVADTDAAPVVVLSPDGEHLRSGLSKDIGEMLASELGMRPEFMLIARKRVEVSIETGRVDIVCNANPDWFGNAARLGWTHEIYPQLERPLTLKQTTELRQTGDLAGKRIVTIRGYNYPTLERFWRSNPASHNEEARMELLVKSVQKRLSDVAIVSELEFAAWARNWPQEAASLKLHPLVVTFMPTMCAVSPHSDIKVAQLNQAIDRLQKSGRIKTVLKTYQWQPQE
ncbi:MULTISPECIES: ABC transporter substrate-binding protein [Chromobacterium]|uniref:Substrate-binding periplasmic protein n=1 Tax=Chromobacterium aquaticum TaxID=467180 RepID=A0ABV8ZY02_9NEIS|nr:MULTISPECIES: transporter substrate-binding domain-containing protein [Chromobacterium]KMN35158.1 ABC transporter substrate-binding protein [Chromobacterium sp. LK1]MCD5364444.1 transporter substrate-binding domain-containing protein [Chromobacterium aquaticum]